MSNLEADPSPNKEALNDENDKFRYASKIREMSEVFLADNSLSCLPPIRGTTRPNKKL